MNGLYGEWKENNLNFYIHLGKSNQSALILNQSFAHFPQQNLYHLPRFLSNVAAFSPSSQEKLSLLLYVASTIILSGQLKVKFVSNWPAICM